MEFVVVSKLGEGAFGTVDRARDPELDREGPLTSPSDVERFLREAKADALKAEIAVLVSGDGQPVDPEFLEIINPGTLILALPSAGPQMGGVFPPPPPKGSTIPPPASVVPVAPPPASPPSPASSPPPATTP